MKREFILEGLNCPNCSAKIQADTEKLPEVSAAVLNLMKQTLTLEISNNLVHQHRDFFSQYLQIAPSGLLGPVQLLK